MSTQESKVLITINMFGLFSSFAKKGQIKFEVDKPADLDKVIFNLDSSRALGLYKECIEEGKIKDGIIILVNGLNPTQGLATIIESGCIITFMTAFSGG